MTVACSLARCVASAGGGNLDLLVDQAVVEVLALDSVVVSG